MSDVFLASRLQAALGDAYRLERELPAGGMSRLFMATETSLNREVVIKVLPPELTSEVSAARFKHEIDLAAHLQHPHVLSILAAGSKDDLLYYVMPFVSGESLRHRLASVGRLPIAEAVAILREVADALAYAHRKGVVHRDIKPENILLLEGHAVIADFGVARAIVAARSGSITESGTSVGTPAYMAPEQAAAEPNIDARADIYALGIVGYEMLTGALPFTGPSAQALLTAHLTEPPPPAIKARGDTPPAVSAAITRALAKAPEDRFRDAGEFRDALHSGQPALVAKHRVAIALAGFAIVVAAVSALIASRHRGRVALDANLLAVAPFDITDPSLQLWHEGMVDVLSRDLDGAGSLRTVSPSLVIQRWEGRADRSSAMALGAATTARLILIGSLGRSGADSVRAKIEILDAADGHTLGAMIERRASGARIDGLADSLTVAVLRDLGKARAMEMPRLSSVGTTSMAALKAFLEGEQFLRHGVYDSAFAHYEQAVVDDSEFAIASMQASAAADWMSLGNPRAPEYALRAARFNHGLSARDSIRIETQYLYAYALHQYRYPQISDSLHKLFETARSGTDRYPDDAEMWYARGEVEMHLSGGGKDGASAAETKKSFDRAVALDSSFAPAYMHLMELGFRDGRSDGRRYMEAYLAHGGMHGDRDLINSLTSSSHVNSATRKRAFEAATIGEMRDALFTLRQYTDSDETLVSLARAFAERVRARAQPVPRDTADLAGDFLAMRGRSREALERGVHSKSLTNLVLLGAIPRDAGDSMMEADRSSNHGCPRCMIGTWGVLGDTLPLIHYMAIRDSLVAGDTTGQAAKAKPYLIALEKGYVQLARRDTAKAMHIFFSLPDSLCLFEDCAYNWLVKARLLESHGHFADAARILDVHGVPGTALDVYVELVRGRIAEEMNDKPRAIDAYAYVVGMWRNADEPFQPYVAEARAGLKRVSGEARGISMQPNSAH